MVQHLTIRVIQDSEWIEGGKFLKTYIGGLLLRAPLDRS